MTAIVGEQLAHARIATFSVHVRATRAADVRSNHAKPDLQLELA